MLTGKKTVTLGDENFTVHPLNLGEIEELIDLIDIMGRGSARERFAATREILRVALSHDNPSLTSDQMKAIVATPRQVTAAVNAVLEVSGFRTSPTGEAEAGAQ